MTDIEIIRGYPYKKNEKSYPYRYDNNIFEKLNEMNEDIELQNNYKKWKDGINYKTNRKITIGGKIHRELEYEKFMVNGIPLDELNSINKDEYLEETKKIINEIDIENAIIKDYNKLVDNIIEKIQKLEDWNELVEFEGKYYGIDKVYNNIHRENNCLGEMVFYKEDKWYFFRDWREDTEHIDFIYKCNKCNYELDYNKLVDNIIEKIQKLEDWNELVEFEGKYYGIDKVYNNIHRENNCLGEMVFYKEDKWYF